MPKATKTITPCKRRLKDLNDLRRFLADIVNKLNRDEIPESRASKLGYLCQILARIIESNDIEKRIARLEEHVSKISHS